MVVKDEKVVGKTTETSVTLKKQSKTFLRVGWYFTRAVGTIQNKNQRIKMRMKSSKRREAKAKLVSLASKCQLLMNKSDAFLFLSYLSFFSSCFRHLSRFFKGDTKMPVTISESGS